MPHNHRISQIPRIIEVDGRTGTQYSNNKVVISGHAEIRPKHPERPNPMNKAVQVSVPGVSESITGYRTSTARDLKFVLTTEIDRTNALIDSNGFHDRSVLSEEGITIQLREIGEKIKLLGLRWKWWGGRMGDFVTLTWKIR